MLPYSSGSSYLALMNLTFRKYQGAGNDFVLFYQTVPAITCSQLEIQKICDRRFGVGSDGLLLVEILSRDHLRIDFFNPDGSVSFCGNGARCALRMAYDDGKINAFGSFIGSDGAHTYEVLQDDVEIEMAVAEPPMAIDTDWYVNTGSPHYVMFREGVDAMDMLQLGRAIRYSERWKEKGVNVNLAEWQSDTLNMRTYERGVEDETLSCGTGVTAAALCAAGMKRSLTELKVKTRGGSFLVSWSRAGNDTFTNVKLRGPAKFVFEGNWHFAG